MGRTLQMVVLSALISIGCGSTQQVVGTRTYDPRDTHRTITIDKPGRYDLNGHIFLREYSPGADYLRYLGVDDGTVGGIAEPILQTDRETRVGSNIAYFEFQIEGQTWYLKKPDEVMAEEQIIQRSGSGGCPFLEVFGVVEKPYER